MALSYNQITVLATAPPTVILAASTTSGNYSEGETEPNRYVMVSNASGTTVYLGDSAVTALTGFALPTATSVTLWLHPDEGLYGLSATGSKVVSYLATGN